MEPSCRRPEAAGPLASLTPRRSFHGSTPRRSRVTLLHDPLPDRDGPRDECGVFGIVAPEKDVARLAYFALYALQHRGQESAGNPTAQGRPIMAMGDQGLRNPGF